jgi:hypothetical protein
MSFTTNLAVAAGAKYLIYTYAAFLASALSFTSASAKAIAVIELKFVLQFAQHLWIILHAAL